jgi:glycosyltransferase involved in cell wall biosynthesis
LNVGFVVTELLDGRFSPWEKVLEWESYLDQYCLAIRRRGHNGLVYIPSIGVSKTETYVHKFGHKIKRIPVYDRLLAPKELLPVRSYEAGYTTVFGQALGLPFTVNLLAEAKRDSTQVLHYSSYYSSFFVPAFLVGMQIPIVVQYTGGALPVDNPQRLVWRLALIPALKASRAVLLGEYDSEIRALVSALAVPTTKQEFFDTPIVDSAVFHEWEKSAAQRKLGFDPQMKNILSVSYIPKRHSLPFAKDPYLMLDIIGRAIKEGGDDISLHLVGFGVGTDEFREYVKAAGLEKRVRLLGKIPHDQLPQYYSACDLVFVPYRLEKLNEGLATIEAFACNRPVAAFKRNDTDSADQQGGFLVEVEPERGGLILLERLRRAGYLEEKGRQGLALSRRYTVEAAGARLEEIYSKVIREGDRS